MLAALLAAYFLSGGGTNVSILTPAAVKQLSQQVEVIVEDPVRSESAKKILKSLRKEIKGFDKEFSKSNKKLTKLYKDHASDMEGAPAIFGDLDVSWEAAQGRAFDLRFELKDLLTREEWEALFAKE